ncbi:MAG: aminoacyl-histidine dipeptidase [Muribaculaceae bacterium]|nr:aminoacyl-histidine dipeptidase [Roseburia sp.]MCM1430389.1 aminoacyl-histidine dipeptidase [Muribaculaceae bacterium]MCM1492415.1 aminoacyl-histidine dipeptidase [Muribaculaceae bacterium]
MMVLEDLYPQRVFYYFEKIAAIPRGSGNTKAVSDYLASFAKEHGLYWEQDDKNNVIVKKKAAAGYENAETVIIQGHMDMVCEKERDCEIDFVREGLSLFVEDGYVQAKGTTLGGDDGIALAYALALLEADIPHPELEVVFTVDEETGMLGAKDIDLSHLKGRRLLNIDSEEEGHFLTSCAGGLSLIGRIPVKRVSQSGRKLRITVTGLAGGHSGAEIHKEHGNADILMGRVLYAVMEESPMGIISLAGGGKDNAIPRECIAEILVPQEMAEQVKMVADGLDLVFQKELRVSDGGVRVLFEDQGSATADMLDYGSVHKVLYYLRTVPDGVLHRSQEMPELVETSLNLGIMELQSDCLYTVTSVRSSVSSRKEDVRERVEAVIALLGGETELEGDYPAWEYRSNSPLREQISAVYTDLYGKPPVFDAIHAGLECGLFAEKIPELDCVSFGPNILDIHTPKERLDIASTGRVWDFLVAFLKQAG